MGGGEVGRTQESTLLSSPSRNDQMDEQNAAKACWRASLKDPLTAFSHSRVWALALWSCSSLFLSMQVLGRPLILESIDTKIYEP